VADERMQSLYRAGQLTIPMSSKSTKLRRHDRQALPRRANPHFLYQAAGPAPDEADRQCLVAAAHGLVQEHGLGAGAIEVFNRRELDQHSVVAGLALERICARLGLDPAADNASVLACEWAPPHEDSCYEGAAFLSHVLHTGEHPYVMSMFHTRRTPGSRAFELRTSTRVLSVGETYVFDPTVPHSAAPAYPSSGALLVLLQAELNLRQPQDYRAVLERFPRHEADCDRQSFFDPVMGGL
jgi:hypothetical protein